MAEETASAPRPDAPETQEEKHGRLRGLTTAVAAFILSLTIAMTSFTQWLLGPELDVHPPKDVWLYRQGEGGRASYAVAVNLPMINAASSYSDVLLDMQLQPLNGAPWFPRLDVVKLVRTYEATAEAGTRFCVNGWRCHREIGLSVSESPDVTMVQIPGGGAHAQYYGFRFVCPQGSETCEDWGFATPTLAKLRNKPLQITIKIEFHGDGERVITCTTAASDLSYLESRGWETLRCQKATVSAPLLSARYTRWIARIWTPSAGLS